MLDPQMQMMIDQATAAGLPPDFRVIGPEAAKLASKEAGARMGAGPAMANVQAVEMPGPNGPIPARVYKPAGAIEGLIVYLHGGGWVVGDLDGYDPVVRTLAKDTHCVVVSVDYRMAPEHPFPVPLEDCYAAVSWSAQNTERLADARVPLIVAGDSAGGNLSAAVALLARERGGPKIDLQVLIYPVTDADFDTPSYKQFAKGLLLTRDAMMWFWEQYVPDSAKRFDPLVSVLRASSLKGLPPALVELAGYDPLLDEGEAYAKRLEKEGVPTRIRRWDGLTHGFFQFALVLEPAGRALQAVAADISRHIKSASR